jgi:hypothetical protein
MMPVLEVGTGVGSCLRPFSLSLPWLPVFCRLSGRGRPGEDEGSKAGSREGARLFTPATAPEEGSGVEVLENGFSSGSVGSWASESSWDEPAMIGELWIVGMAVRVRVGGRNPRITIS